MSDGGDGVAAKPDYEVARDELRALVDGLGLEVRLLAVFGEFKDNWPRITYKFQVNGETFEYGLGVGHVKWSRPCYYAGSIRDSIMECMECMAKGQMVRADYQHLVADIAAELAREQNVLPDISEVLACCAREGVDAEVDFEEWCADFGYDTDSRKAEAVHRQCRESGRKALKVLGREAYAKAVELYSLL
jgi:hypothetical protein